MSAREITHHLVITLEVNIQRRVPTCFVANLPLADQVKLLEPLEDPRNVILVVEVARVDADQTVAVGAVLARRDLSSDA